MRHWLLVGLLLLSVAAAAGQPAPPPIPPVELTAAWATVPLPAMPLHAMEHQGALWVTGDDAMIARSTDGGGQWQILHLRHFGAMLFALTLGEAGELDAYGTDGAHWTSRDGGQTWREAKFDDRQGLLNAKGLASGVVYAQAYSGPAASHDGGQHWRFGREHSGLSQPFGLAVLNDTHAAMLDSAASDNFRWTNDGGKHWQSAALSSEESWRSLVAVGGQYVLLGKREKGGPVEAKQGAAGRWEITNLKTDLTACTTEGCLATGAGWSAILGSDRLACRDTLTREP